MHTNNNYFDSDEEVAWGQYSMAEAKKDIQSTYQSIGRQSKVTGGRKSEYLPREKGKLLGQLESATPASPSPKMSNDADEFLNKMKHLIELKDSNESHNSTILEQEVPYIAQYEDISNDSLNSYRVVPVDGNPQAVSSSSPPPQLPRAGLLSAELCSIVSEELKKLKPINDSFSSPDVSFDSKPDIEGIINKLDLDRTQQLTPFEDRSISDSDSDPIFQVDESIDQDHSVNQSKDSSSFFQETENNSIERDSLEVSKIQNNCKETLLHFSEAFHSTEINSSAKVDNSTLQSGLPATEETNLNGRTYTCYSESSLDLDNTLEEMEMVLKYGFQLDNSESNNETSVEPNNKQDNGLEFSDQEITNPGFSTQQFSSRIPLTKIKPSKTEQLPVPSADVNKDFFKVPEKPVRVKTTPTSTPSKKLAKTPLKSPLPSLNLKFKNVVSPVGLYIKNPTPVFRQNVSPRTVKAMPSYQAQASKTPSKTVLTNIENTELPFTIYKPAKTKVVHDQKTVKLPESYKKLVPEIVVTKHERRLNHAADNSSGIRNKLLLEENMTFVSDENSLLDNGDVSVLINRQGFIK